jgi:DNA-binding CsgD family transcriptional regulator
VTVTESERQEWIDAWSEAVRTSPVALGLLDLASTRLIALSPQAAELLTTPGQAGDQLDRLALVVVLDAIGRDARPAASSGGPALSGLTPRQWEVVSRLARGHQVAAIAAEMQLSRSTVRNHLSAAFRKLGVHSQRGLLELLHRD